jgi:regulator of RNase E activity RraA
MADVTQLRVRRKFLRPSADEIEAFKSVPTSWLVDAQGRRGALPYWIRAFSQSVNFVGTALTVRARPVDNLACYAALKFARPGDVLVIDVAGSESASIVGGTTVGMAKNAGIVAVVTDGLLRDVEEINRIGIPVYGRALSPNSPYKDGPGEIGEVISLGDVTISPGDLIVGDIDGVVVVPRLTMPEVRAALSAIAKKEAEMDAAVERGATYPPWLDDVLGPNRLCFLD